MPRRSAKSRAAGDQPSLGYYPSGHTPRVTCTSVSAPPRITVSVMTSPGWSPAALDIQQSYGENPDLEKSGEEDREEYTQSAWEP